jgi:hypothetical protein
VADFYRQKVEEILAMDEQTWLARAPHVEQVDREISAGFVQQGLSHYAIKYNRCMGVISDYFTAEDGSG